MIQTTMWGKIAASKRYQLVDPPEPLHWAQGPSGGVLQLHPRLQPTVPLPWRPHVRGEHCARQLPHTHATRTHALSNVSAKLTFLCPTTGTCRKRGQPTQYGVFIFTAWGVALSQAKLMSYTLHTGTHPRSPELHINSGRQAGRQAGEQGTCP